MRKPKIYQAQREDLLKFYKGSPPSFTMSAWVGSVNGRIIACGGIGYLNGQAFAFLDLKPSARKYKLSLVRAAKQSIESAKTFCSIIFAQVDKDEPNARKWLYHLGFSDTDNEGIMVWRAVSV